MQMDPAAGGNRSEGAGCAQNKQSSPPTPHARCSYVWSGSTRPHTFAPSRRAVVAAHKRLAGLELGLGRRAVHPRAPRGRDANGGLVDHLAQPLRLQRHQILVVDEGDAVPAGTRSANVRASSASCGWHAALTDAARVVRSGRGYIHWTTFDRLHDDLWIVLPLRVSARTTSIRMHHECVSCDVSTVRAANALGLVDVDKAQLLRLAVFVQVKLQVRRDVGVFHQLFAGLLYAAKKCIHQPLVRFRILSTQGHHPRSTATRMDTAAKLVHAYRLTAQAEQQATEHHPHQNAVCRGYYTRQPPRFHVPFR